MSAFLEDRKTRPAVLGHILLTAVFIAVPVLMFVPSIYLSYDSGSISKGDIVYRTDLEPRVTSDPFTVIEVTGNKSAVVKNQTTGRLERLHLITLSHSNMSQID